MNRCILGLSLALSVSLGAAPAQAQIFFKKPRPAPETPQTPAPTPQQLMASEQQKIAEAIYAAKSDPDDRKRTRSIGALEGVDAKAHPEVLATLAEIAIRDAQPHLRADAMSSLARIRPMSGIAAQTLEKAAEGDAAWRNRVHAKTLSLRYNLTYRPTKDEPVLTATPPQQPALTNFPTVSNRFPPTGPNLKLPLIRDADVPNFAAPSLTPSESIPNFQPAPAPTFTPPVNTPPSQPKNTPSRFIPLPKLGDPKAVEVLEIPMAPSIAPELPKPVVQPRIEIPMVITPAKPAEPEIIIPALPNEPTVIVPAPMRPAVPVSPVIPTTPIETGPVLAPLPGNPPGTRPLPMPISPGAPVQPMPDDVVLPPKF
ncbi:MAG: hypothetical protein K2X38_11185 [Gemmataceae bacterium]|nr:hypothetical protein [Gemmataceae bacterium]